MKEMEDNVSDNEGAPKKRGRKKQLYKNIVSQMEFYFSSSSLSKDRWLSRKLEKEGDVHLTEFLKFNKIRALTQDMNDLTKALRKSKILTVTEDMKVKRTQPVKYKENEDDYIIYIEQIPSDVDHVWLSSLFSKYGKIDYISIPKFKNSNKCKGFAFVEFAEMESAEKAISDYKKNGNYLSTDIEPSDLISIATYEEPKVGDSDTYESDMNSEVFHATNEMDTDESDKPLHEKKEIATSGKDELTKKRKISNTPDEIQQKKSKVEVTSDEEQLSIKKDENFVQSDGIANESEKDDENVASAAGNIDELKKKKNRKKKSKKKKNNDETESTSLQILSKKDWKKLRNKYLNMQKEKMKQLKKHIFLAKKKDETCKNNAFKIQEKSPTGQEDNNNDGADKNDTFTPGLIVKIKLDEPATEVKELKMEMRKNDGVQFIDVKEGENLIYLRFDCTEKASEFCKNSTWPKTKLLKGEEEVEYWKIIQERREEKLTKNTKKKERGKDKLMRKAENILGKHITFD